LSTDFVFCNLEEVNVIWICWFRDIVEICDDERRKEEIDSTLNFCFFDKNHNVVRTTKKRRDKFERRWTIVCLFDAFSRFLSVFWAFFNASNTTFWWMICRIFRIIRFLIAFVFLQIWSVCFEFFWTTNLS
jgi:hypothetical protein